MTVAPDPPAPRDPERRAHVVFAVLAGLVGVAIVLRLLRIGVREAWLDEACTSLFAQSDGLGGLFDLLGPESHPPLYYLLLQGWTSVFGASEVALRFPSLLAGVALVPLVFAAVRRFGGSHAAALLGAGLAAASPLLLYYGVEAKGYTLLWSLGLALTLALHRAGNPDGEGGRFWWIASALSVAALYTHHFALLLLPLWGLAVLGAPRDQRLRGVVAGAVAVALYAPWAVGFLSGQAEAGGTACLAGYWRGGLSALADSSRVMALAPPFPPYLGELGRVALPSVAGMALAFWFGAPALAGLGVVLCRKTPTTGPVARRALLVAGLLLPTLGAVVVSVVWRPFYLPGRYELLAYPAWIALWALGLGAAVRLLPAPKRLWAWLALVPASAALLALPTVPYVTQPADPWHHRAAARHLHDQAAPHEVIVAVGLTRAPLEHQLRQLDAPPLLLSYPPEVARHVGWWTPSVWTDTHLRSEAERVTIALLDRPGIWVVTALGNDGELATPRVAMPLFATLRQSGRNPGPPEVFGHLGVVRFSTPPPGGGPAP